MTLFPGRAGAGAHPTVTRRPPFPHRQRPRTATAGPQDRRSSPRGPGDADQDDAVGGGGLDRPRAGPVTPPNRDDGDCRRPRRSRAAIDWVRTVTEGSSVLVVEDLDLHHPVHHGQGRQ